MFYISTPSNSHYPNVKVGSDTRVGFVTLPSYAESMDGINWERPLRRDSDLGERVGKPATLRIEMRNADLYAFWTT
ncbi:MAG: hypothetical protein ACKV22_41910 [Bryobacteraceae bacterium]